MGDGGSLGSGEALHGSVSADSERERILHLVAEKDAWQQEAYEQSRHAAAALRELHNTRAELAAARGEAQLANARIEQICRSTSWRVTGPLRRLSQVLRRR